MPTLKAKVSRAANRALDACHLPVAFYLFYVAIYTMINGAGVLMSQVPGWLTWGWCGALLLGAVLTTVGTLRDCNRLESSGHGFHLFGIGLYALTSIMAVGFTSGLLVVVLTLGGVSCSRLHVLRRSRKAKRVASRIVRGE